MTTSGMYGPVDGSMLVTFSGEIDMATVDVVDSALVSALATSGVTGLVVDFFGVTFCESSGIAALDRAYAAAAARRISFRLINAAPQIRAVLVIVGLWETLTEP